MTVWFFFNFLNFCLEHSLFSLERLAAALDELTGNFHIVALGGTKLASE